MEIEGNDLVTIQGLDHPIDIEGELIIEGCTNLSECDVQAVCDHINANNATTIENNMTGCNSVQEVEAFCSVCTGDFVLTTQQEIDDFATNHPTCTQIEGNLVINGITPTEINNLDGLSQLIGVSDTLFIIDNQVLTDISGLSNIIYTDPNHLQISGNSMLSACSIENFCNFIIANGTASIDNNNENCNSEAEILDNCVICPEAPVHLYSQAEVDAFSALYPNCSTISHAIRIMGDDINNLNGLIQIEHLEDRLTIQDCPALTDLSGLDNLESAAYIIFKGNGLTDISALSNLTIVQVTFEIEDSNVDLAVLENLRYVGGLEIDNNATLTDLSFLSNLDSLGNIRLYRNENLINLNGLQGFIKMGSLTLIDNDALVSLDGLNNIIRANTVSIAENTSLLSLEGFNSLTEVSRLYIGDNYSENPTLQSLSGLDNLTTINVELQIMNSEQLSNLEGLNSLTSIGQRLIISNNSALDNLNGLENLVTIGDDFIIFNNVLTSLSGLESLATIGGDLTIENNDALSNLSSLENLTTIGGDLVMIYNDGLITLEGLNNLQTINGNLKIGDDTVGIGQAGNALEDISALSSLTNINGELRIWGNYNLTTINNTLENLDHTTITSIVIAYNENLSMCSPQVVCDYLNAGTGDIYFFFNASGCDEDEVEAACSPMLACPSVEVTLVTQQEIDAFSTTYPNCTQLPEKLIIRADNPADIINLESLSQLTSIGNGLVIDNTSITNLNGLQNLTTTGYNLVIMNNPNLTSLLGLEGITATASHLKIENNDALTDLSGLNNITQVGESVLIFDNDNLQTLTGLDALTSIGAQLYLNNNTNLNSLSGLVGSVFGLENLTSIGTDIRIQNNSGLTSLNALSNVTTINGYIRLIDNNALTSLMGLENIDPDGITEIRVMNNANLSMCSASSICGHVEDNGMTIISNNAEGCNNAEEVQDACDALPIEMTTPLRVYLNNKTAILTWKIATEINNAGFEIQRSKDGIEWEKIGWQTGQGSTSTAHSYTYTDRNPLFGTSYYRLRQVDFNGDVEYSNTVTLKYIRNSVTVYPNPVREQLYLHTNHGLVQKITVYNSIGVQVAQITNPGNSIDVSTLPQGIYVLKIGVDDEDFYEKILVE